MWMILYLSYELHHFHMEVVSAVAQMFDEVGRPRKSFPITFHTASGLQMGKHQVGKIKNIVAIVDETNQIDHTEVIYVCSGKH